MLSKKFLLTMASFLLGVSLYSQNIKTASLKIDSLNSIDSKQELVDNSSWIQSQSKIVPGNTNSGLAMSFQRLTVSTPYNSEGGRLKLAWDQRPINDSYFTTLTITEPFKTKNLEIYLSDQGDFIKENHLNFIELATFGKFKLGSNVDATYFFNPGIGFGNGLKKFWGLDDEMVFMISQASLNIKNDDGKSVLFLTGDYLPLIGLSNSDHNANYWASSMTVADHYMLAYGELNKKPIVHFAYLENKNFGWYTTARFDAEDHLTSTWTHIGIGNTKNSEGKGFFTKYVMQLPGGPVNEQSTSPFMFNYHSSWLSKGDYSVGIFTHHSTTTEGSQHSVKALVGKKDLGPIPLSAGLGAKIDLKISDVGEDKQEESKVTFSDPNISLSIYSNKLHVGPVNVELETNYTSDFSGKTWGDLSGYLNVKYVLPNKKSD